MTLKEIAVLFADIKGPYNHINGIDLWTINRDAREYNGDLPVIAHPPCGRWCSMAVINEKRWGAKIGDDQGCFESALKNVRRCNGVLEHPANSLAWSRFNIAIPNFGVWTQTAEKEWTTEVWQSSYGHVARKRTWLFYSGEYKPFDLDWLKYPGMFQVGGGINTGNNQLPRCPESLTHITPFPFALELCSLSIYSNTGTKKAKRDFAISLMHSSNKKALNIDDI